MAEKAPDPSEPLDVQKVHYLVRLMKRYDLTDLDLSDGPVKISLKRRGPEVAQPSAHIPPAHAYALPPQPAPRPDSPPAVSSPKTVVIESPMVGTYYSSSAPDTPTFVNVGSTVQPDTTVCIIEAMKVFTEIPAGVSGTIAEILVKNGQAVEYGQPMFRVLPA